MVITSRYFLVTINHPFYYNTSTDDDVENYLISNVNMDAPLSVVDNSYDDLVIDDDYLHHNYNFNNLEELIDYCYSFEDIRGVVGQVEKGGDCHTVHAHVYLEFKKSKKWGTIKKYLPTANLNDEEIRDRAKCILYVQKTETRIVDPISKGEFNTQGKRNDLEQYKNAIINGASDVELIETFEDIDSKYHKWGEHVRLVSQEEKISNGNRKLKVYYIYSLKGYDLYDFVRNFENDLYVVNDYDCMFLNYKNEKAVMLDDFVNSLDLQKLISLLKKTTTTINVKYSFKVASYERIYICSCVAWEEQLKLYRYDKRPQLIVRLQNLVDEVINIDNFDKYSGDLLPVYNDFGDIF